MAIPFGGKDGAKSPASASAFGKGKRNPGMSFKPKVEKMTKAIKTPQAAKGNPY